MSPNSFNDLKELLEKLPGIGPRQASRFIWAMLDFEPKERENMASLINSLDQHLKRCGECLRAHLATKSPSGDLATVCSFCQPISNRDHSKIMVVERDSDLLNIEKSKIYGGLYHVLGGALDLLEKDEGVRKSIKFLKVRAESGKVKEIILALSPVKLGEFTAGFIEKVFEPFSKPASPAGGSQKLKISRLARGLATGTDLEYADETTLKQAIDNRK
ncbi:hypothetical protein A3G55_03270 [Candidatus Giovannonibacteria bacterium RIFCSPLOWO2_12_FULL_44_25]|uniref:Recombination protein RecR n=3 Tax=Parcubacteria group TaxID=1794811 RepID=A0A837IGY7_9BACT|nr:MAG: Recombination protein RecR [Parcubacteria group bacterium GW2011_GWC1_44_10]KKT60042.1 MAG: Recombination protein RecR [Candidatus Giovannonibacteria bacterium GW2011_GWA1_44_25]KKU12892.1 MAG: Recombination protein RecR [Candidatus Azambacteria bacterium GW2011_GWC2_45_7b]KKU30160.1 MAG: Recombination protein RecR [Candidatus Giovannonibacteria bacterium GW2011_GWB1_46_20]OGF49744.1 MAG: hypothetical protein A2120_00340 [Candidatus Giovannonibacteria bacterium GWA2_45_15]OGF59453.1 MA